MGPVLLRARAQVRARWGVWLFVALLIGVAGGAVLTTAAGARRTSSAYARYLRSSHAADLLVSPTGRGTPAFYAALGHIKGARTVAPDIGYGVAPADHVGTPVLVVAATNGRYGRTLERPKLTAGRLPAPGAINEVLADNVAARALKLKPGSVLPVVVANNQEELPNPARDPKIALRVVGIGVTRDNVVTTNALAVQPTLLAGPAFATRFGPDYYAFDGAYIALDPGASKSAFGDHARAIAQEPQFRATTQGGVFISDETAQAAQVEHAIRPQAVALALFALLVAITFIVTIALIVARQVALVSADNPTLASLGMGRAQMVAVVLLQVAVAAVVGACVALIVAAAASPTMPIGPARIAEPHPGVALDWFVLAAGFGAIVLLVVAVAVVPAWRATRVQANDRADTGARRSTFSDWSLRAGVRPSVAIGVGQATDPGRGRSAVPARSSLTGVTVAVIAVTGALTFGVNLADLVHTPKRYGQTWDVTADAQFSALPPGISAELAKEPGVTAWTFGEHGDITVDGNDVPAIGVAAGRGTTLSPTIVDGRAAADRNEIALGQKVLDSIHRRVGDTVQVNLAGVQGGGKPVPMQIVGRSTFPFFGHGSFTPTGLGVGAQVADTPHYVLNPGDTQAGFNFVLVQVAPGRDHDANVARLRQDLVSTDLCGLDNQCTVTTTARPVDIVNYDRVLTTPIALAAVLGFLAVLIVAYLLITSVRRRRHDLAILKVLGFTRRQVSAAIAWQATTLAVVALAVGIPLGLVLGRFAWATFATNLPVPSDPVTPTVALALAVPTALLIANLVALGPGISAARRRPAAALRTQ